MICYELMFKKMSGIYFR